jgi:nicotinamidase-related amidase
LRPRQRLRSVAPVEGDTAIAARELGFKVSILVDACASVDEREEKIALDSAENVVGARLERAGA